MSIRRPKKILLDLTPLDTPSRPRGIGRYIRELAMGLAELPREEHGDIELLGLTSLTWTGNYTVTSDLSSFEGSPQLAFPTGSDFYRWAYRHRIALWRAARRIGASAVHLCDPHATPLLFPLSGCRKMVTCHDLVGTRFPDQYLGFRDGGAFLGKRIERRRYRSADLVIAISEATRRDCIDLLGVPAERVVRVYNGVDVDRWAAEPALSTASVLTRYELGTRPFVLYVGGADWRKNIDGMIAGLAHAHARGTQLDLAWAGHLEPSYAHKAQTAAQQAGVAPYVHLLGYVPDGELSVLYRAAIAHVQLSRYEGFGLTVVEAMAAGCPVVTTAIGTGGSLAEVAGDAALLVDPEDHAAIGQTLERLVREPSLRGQLGQRGQQRAKRFSRATQASTIMQVYRQFLNPPIL